MNIYFLKSSFKNHQIEISVSTIILFCFFMACYFLFLKLPIHQYQLAKKYNIAQLRILKQKRDLAQQVAQAQKTLTTWQQKDLAFYKAAQLNQTQDALLQKIAVMAQESKLSIMQAMPDKKGVIRFNLSGQYQDLFYFIEKIKNGAWPVMITKIEIPHQGQFKCTLTSLS